MIDSELEPYVVPKWLVLRLVLLLMGLCGSVVVASVIAFTVPVSVGRWFMSVYRGGKPQYHLYTVAACTNLCWLIISVLFLFWKCAPLVVSWVARGRDVLVETVRPWSVLLAKSVVALGLLVGVIPLMSGRLIELVLLKPLPLGDSPVLRLWQDWALGVLSTKIICVLTMMGAEGTLRQVIERVVYMGIQGKHLSCIINNLALPITSFLAVAISLPYLMAHSIVPFFISTQFFLTLIQRFIYLLFIVFQMVGFRFTFHLLQSSHFYEQFKNDKSLICRLFINNHHRNILHT